MGTRNLTMAVVNGQMKLAQYGQWDGYFTGQGDTIQKFIKRLLKEDGISTMKKLLLPLTPVSQEYLKNCWQSCSTKKIGDFVSLDISEKFKVKYPEFCRDTGAEILNMVYDGKVVKVDLDEAFVYNSLFCEYAYVLDFDNEKIELYTGFNKTPLSKNERFYSEDNKNEYGPVKLFKIFSFKEYTEVNLEQLDNIYSDERKRLNG